MIKEAIAKVIEKQNLTYDEGKQVMTEIMDGTATQSQMASFLTALRMKGETIEEITAFASVMREKATKITSKKAVMDIVGTGGDGVGTFNISTTSSFVAAAGGVIVAKHGNRSASSKSGAADVLESLGANITINAEQSSKLLNDIGICFMFAPTYHSSMKYAAPVRKEIAVRTIFNILGPLSNPAAAELQIMGVFDKKLVEPLAQVLSNLGVKRGMAIYGDGLDEATVTGKTTICEINNGTLTTYEIEPQELGLGIYSLDEIKGGTPAENAQITLDILSGKEKGAKLDIVILNSALALYCADKGKTIKECVALAKQLIEDGSAIAKLNQFIAQSNEVVA
ncbi:MAG: anthranilate phosphoribosyltransferase [Lachnospiraceae bacterium]|nr:anthranilate phosphoribosyltransferase [Lachnospiraceae bacterium]